MAELSSKGWLGRLIERLAEASDREFHGRPPSCCAGKTNAFYGGHETTVQGPKQTSNSDKCH